LGVVFEFDYGDGPTLMYASADGFSCIYWVGGGVKAPHYDGGLPVELTHKISHLAKEYLPSIYDELDVAGSLPPRPRLGTVRISLITSKGLWTVLLPKDKLKQSSSGIGGIYKHFVQLFGALLGASQVSFEEPLARAKGSNFLVGSSLSLESILPRVSSLNSRIYAFLFDLGFYALFFSILTYFVSFFLNFGDVMVSLFYIGALLTLAPFFSAWMESSVDWGFATLGKRLFGLRVYRTDDADETLGPSFLQAFARNTTKFLLSPLFCFTGFMWALYSPYHRAWHDLLADTIILDPPSGTSERL